VPRLSCIIPVVGHAHGLETTLVSVLEHFPDDCEIVVVHSAPYDDPYDLKSELRFIEAPARTGYVGCANLGLQASRAPIVHLLAAGLEATGGWAEAALDRFADPQVAAVAPIVRNQFDSDEILAAGISYHRGGRAEIRTALPPDSHLPDALPTDSLQTDCPAAEANTFPIARAAFYRRQALNQFGGGFPTSVGNELAAAELGLSLSRAGYRSVLEPGCKILGSAKSCHGSRGFGFGLSAERLFWRNLPTTGYLTSMAMHPWSVARELIGSLSNGAAILQLLGRIVAYATLGDCRTRHEQLRAAEALAVARTGRPIPAGLPAHLRIDSAHRLARAGHPSDVRASHS
jgi:hypothetical protein